MLTYSYGQYRDKHPIGLTHKVHGRPYRSKDPPKCPINTTGMTTHTYIHEVIFNKECGSRWVCFRDFFMNRDLRKVRYFKMDRASNHIKSCKLETRSLLCDRSKKYSAISCHTTTNFHAFDISMLWHNMLNQFI
jgi:hypothetical protein